MMRNKRYYTFRWQIQIKKKKEMKKCLLPSGKQIQSSITVKPSSLQRFARSWSVPPIPDI